MGIGSHGMKAQRSHNKLSACRRPRKASWMESRCQGRDDDVPTQGENLPSAFVFWALSCWMVSIHTDEEGSPLISLLIQPQSPMETPS